MYSEPSTMLMTSTSNLKKNGQVWILTHDEVLFIVSQWFLTGTPTLDLFRSPHTTSEEKFVYAWKHVIKFSGTPLRDNG